MIAVDETTMTVLGFAGWFLAVLALGELTHRRAVRKRRRREEREKWERIGHGMRERLR